MRSFIILLAVLCCSVPLFSQEVDPGFNPPIFSKANITQATFDSEGYIYFTGSYDLVDREPRFGISKLNADGSLNEDFSIGSGFDGDILRIVSLSTDKLLIIGNFTEYNGVATGPMVRVNGDGSIDAGFAKATGIASPNQNPISNVIELASGKLLVYGEFASYDDLATNSIVILNADGTVDESFRHENEDVMSVLNAASQSSGKIVIGLNRVNSPSGLITRLNADGTTDETFNNFDTGSNSVYKIMTQSTDKLLVLADSPESDQSNVDLIRLNSDGTSDDSFDLGTGIDGFFHDFQLNSDDEIFIGSVYTQTEQGGSIDGNSIGLISRLGPDGAFGKSFSASLFGDSSRVALGKNNEVAIAGRFLSVEGHATRGIALFNIDEVRDVDFIADIRSVGETSIATSYGGSNIYLGTRYSEEFDSLGRIGGFLKYRGLVNALYNLEIDIEEIRVFKGGGGGRVVAGGPAGSGPIFRVQDTDDRGFVFNSEEYRFNDNWVNDIGADLYGNESVFAVGSFSGYNGLTDGVAGIVLFASGPGPAGAGVGDVDTAFKSPFRADSVNITDVKYDDGKVVVAGVFAPAGSEETELINGIARLNPNGSFDETFDWSNHFSGGIIRYVEVVEDGYIIVGDFTAPRRGIAKINNDGSLNTEFNADDSFLFNEIADAQMFGESIYVGGDLTEYQGQQVYGLMKLDLDGNLDDGFKLPHTLSAKVNDIDIDHEQIFTLAGLFYDSIQSRKLSAVRLGFGPDAAPTNLRQNSISYDLVSLSWDESVTNEDGFRIEISKNGSFTSPNRTSVGANSTVYESYPSENGTTLYYRVAAVRANFKSEYSNIVEVAVPERPLAPPTNLHIDDLFIDEVFFGWDHTAEQEDGFVIERSENDQQNFVAIDSNAVYKTTYRDPYVEFGGIYFYRVRAFKGSERSSEYSNVLEVAILHTTKPEAPTDLTGVVISPNQIDLNWTDNSDNEENFVIFRIVNEGEEQTIVTVAANQTSFSDTNVDIAQQTLEYYVWARNNLGRSPSSNVVHVNTPPVAPSHLTGSFISDNQIDLSWTDNSDNEESFIIARTVNQGDVETIGTVAANQTSFSDTNVDIAQTLEYWVWAKNIRGDSPVSDILRMVIASNGEVSSGKDSRYDFSYDPITNDLVFKLNTPSDKIRGYQVLTGSGVMRMQEEGLEAQQLNLNLSGNASGVYIIHVMSEQEKYVVKFIKK